MGGGGQGVNYLILPNKRTPIINVPPTVWGRLEWLYFTKMGISPLMFDRFPSETSIAKLEMRTI